MPTPPSPSLAVIGAGPAGLMAAEVLARAGRTVTVYERMPTPARKLLLAGRGGLNLTHSEDESRFLARYGAAAPRLAPALATLAPQDLRAWCEGLGQETFVGSSGRVFPRAMKASPLLRACLRRLEGLGVILAPGHRWLGWTPEGRLRFALRDGSEHAAEAAATILALGGASWPRLGSDGAWTEILGDEGIPVAPLRPANMGARIAWSEPFRSRFEGAPLKRIALAFEGESVRGEAVVTASGLEGGAVYALSGRLREALARGPAAVALDLRPDLPHEALARRLSSPRGKQSTATFLRKAASLPPVAVALLRESFGPDLPREPAALAAAVKSVSLALAGVEPIDRAISSAGGIAFGALDERFMLEARPGTFAAGEMIDWEAPTGGYLLQAAFATGAAAARGALAWLEAREPAPQMPH